MKRASHARWRRFASWTNGDHAIALITIAFSTLTGKRNGRVAEPRGACHQPVQPPLADQDRDRDDPRPGPAARGPEM